MDGLTPKQSRALAKWFNSKSVQKMIQEGTLANKRIIMEAVKREGLGVLRRYGPKSARRIKSIRVILKGGPGSGHWGHQGRPGKVGGSQVGSMTSSTRINRRYFEVGPGRKLVEGLPRDMREGVTKVLINSKLNNNHLFEFNGFSHLPPKGMDSFDIPADYVHAGYKLGEAAAYYDGRENTIHLNPNADVGNPANVIFHELGHHQHTKSPFRKSGHQFELIEEDMYPKLKRKPLGELWNMGLREYSITNERELVADLYMVHMRGSIDNRNAVNQWFSSNRYRGARGNPLTLEEIFDGEMEEEF